MASLTNTQKCVRLPHDANRLRFNILRGLNSLDKFREFLNENEINNPNLWNMLMEIELKLTDGMRKD